MKDLVVLISGSGSNLQAIIDACQQQQINARVRAVISNKSCAFGLERARKAKIDNYSLSAKAYASRAAFDAGLMQLIDQYQPHLVILAGYMRILSPAFVTHYHGRLLNIHPSLLPRHPGLNTHQRALCQGDNEHGASVHFVTEELDAGPVILQGKVPILAEDTVESLATRVHQQEHLIYPQAIAWFVNGRLKLQHNAAWLDGQPLPPSGA